MERDMGQVPNVHVENSPVPLLKSLALLVLVTSVAIAIAPYTMLKKEVTPHNATHA